MYACVSPSATQCKSHMQVNVKEALYNVIIADIRPK